MESKVQLGPISEGTLRTQDLLVTFLMELDSLNKRASQEIIDSIEELTEGEKEELIGFSGLSEDHPWWDSEEASFLVEDLMDALQNECPDFTHFGTLEGDGACFGFWSVV